MELFDFGIPALDKALNLTATVLLLLALGMLLIRVILRLCDRAFDRSERLAPFRTYLRSTLRAVLYILLALAVLGSIGVEITSFVALLSVAGLAVSLSLQNTLSNVAGGVMLLISKPFTVGDYVSCDGIEGAVRAVDLAYTTFTTVDNKEIFVPNSQIVAAKIVNYNALGRRRVDLIYTASYDAPTETVRTAILEAVAAFPQVTDEPAPTVVLSEYGASSISYLARLWVSAADYWTVYYGMNEKVRETFAAHGLRVALNAGVMGMQLDQIQCYPYTSPEEDSFGCAATWIEAESAYAPTIDPTTGKRFVNELTDRKRFCDAMFEVGTPLVQIGSVDNVPDWCAESLENALSAGEATGGVHGACRLGCNGTLDCLVNGRIAGQQVAALEPVA